MWNMKKNREQTAMQQQHIHHFSLHYWGRSAITASQGNWCLVLTLMPNAAAETVQCHLNSGTLYLSNMTLFKRYTLQLPLKSIHLGHRQEKLGSCLSWEIHLCRVAGRWRSDPHGGRDAQQQGSWTTWEAVTNRAITWDNMCRIPQARLSSLIRSTYSSFPSPRNVNCHLCDAQKPSLKHIHSTDPGPVQLMLRSGPAKVGRGLISTQTRIK